MRKQNMYPALGGSWRGVVAAGLLVLSAFTAGWTCRGEATVQAQVRQEVMPDHFKSGAARSELVLREIAATLKQMEGRVERIERAAIRLSGEHPGAAR